MSLSLEQASGGNFCLSKAGLSVGSTNTQLSTAAIVSYTIDGVFMPNKAVTATFAGVMAPVSIAEVFVGGVQTLMPLVANPVPVGSKCSWGVWADSAGALTLTQSAILAVTSTSDKAAPPLNPGSRTLIGVFTTYAVSAAFVLGTNVLTAGTNAGVTVTYFDVMTLPSIGF
jgi:hypothetical protein